MATIGHYLEEASTILLFYNTVRNHKHLNRSIIEPLQGKCIRGDPDVPTPSPSTENNEFQTPVKKGQRDTKKFITEVSGQKRWTKKESIAT